MDREEPVSARFTCVLSPGLANGRGGAVATPKRAGSYLPIGRACCSRGGVSAYPAGGGPMGGAGAGS